MRIALISDIHANLPALEATLADISQQGVDQIIFLGDAATLGPHPKETLDVLRSLECICIKGNHDAALLDLSKANDLQIGPPLHSNLAWGHSLLNEKDFEFLRSFLPTYQLNIGAFSLLCYHASPRSNIEMVLSTTSEPRMDEYFADFTADLNAGGHTHIQMVRQRGKQIVINPGSVGSAFVEPFTYSNDPPTLLPWAEYAIIRAENNGLSVDLRRIAFDTQAVQSAVAACGIPSKEWWLSQYR
jgi:predicted phosphodiesterase